jgi:hypothetical protein
MSKKVYSRFQIKLNFCSDVFDLKSNITMIMEKYYLGIRCIWNGEKGDDDYVYTISNKPIMRQEQGMYYHEFSVPSDSDQVYLVYCLFEGIFEDDIVVCTEYLSAAKTFRWLVSGQKQAFFEFFDEEEEFDEKREVDDLGRRIVVQEKNGALVSSVFSNGEHRPEKTSHAFLLPFRPTHIPGIFEFHNGKISF